MGWQTMDTAPRDGSAIQAEIGTFGSDYIIAWTGGYYDSNQDPCSCWNIVDDQEPPPDWTDGVCWSVNEDGVPSTPPTRWKPLPVGSEEKSRPAASQ